LIDRKRSQLTRPLANTTFHHTSAPPPHTHTHNHAILLFNTADATNPNILLPTRALTGVNATGLRTAINPATAGRRVLNSRYPPNPPDSPLGSLGSLGSRGRNSRLPPRPGDSPSPRGRPSVREPVAGSRRIVRPKSLCVRYFGMGDTEFYLLLRWQRHSRRNFHIR
jgi:hypothetical protein